MLGFFSPVLSDHREKQGRDTLVDSSRKQMVEELKNLQISSPDIQASAVVSVDGLIIASALPANVEEAVTKVRVMVKIKTNFLFMMFCP